MALGLVFLVAISAQNTRCLTLASPALRLYTALMLFRTGKLSSGAAAEMAGLPRVMFLDLCAEYDIPVSQVTADDLRRELAVD